MCSSDNLESYLGLRHIFMMTLCVTSAQWFLVYPLNYLAKRSFIDVLRLSN